MRFSLLIVVLLASLAGFPAIGMAEDGETLSPLQSQLQKMQSGEQYGMKTLVVAPAAPTTKPKEALNENAKALAEQAVIESSRPTRLELIEEAYKKATPPADANKPVATKDQDIKAAAKKENPDDDQVMFETMHTDTPKVPPRLIPVE